MIRFEDVSFPLEATENQLLRIGSAIDSAFEFVLCCLDALTFVSICIPCFAVVYPFGAAGLAVRCPRRRWTKFVRCTFCENVKFLDFFQRFLRDLVTLEIPGFGRGTGWAQRLLRPDPCAASTLKEQGWIWKLLNELFTIWDMIFKNQKIDENRET